MLIMKIIMIIIIIIMIIIIAPAKWWWWSPWSSLEWVPSSRIIWACGPCPSQRFLHQWPFVIIMVILVIYEEYDSDSDYDDDDDGHNDDDDDNDCHHYLSFGPCPHESFLHQWPSEIITMMTTMMVMMTQLAGHQSCCSWKRCGLMILGKSSSFWTKHHNPLDVH